MPELVPLFPAAALPAPFTQYDPTRALPDFAERLRHLRRWQQGIADGYVRSQKEEALQAEFLNLLFGQVLGYEYQATTHRQLQLELKTLTDGTKPDGALGDFVASPGGGLGGPVRAVVELKDARTPLDAKQRGHQKGRAETPVEQAFSYPSKFGSACRWVLVSNFVELRLYAASDQTRAEIFRLDTLPDQPEQLRRFFALLLPAHLLPAPGRAEALLDEALQQRQQEEIKITKSFYKDYSLARRQLLDHLIEQNPAVPPLELLAHTQKLLDRVIFVCFCEDKAIIPRQTFRRLLNNVRENNFDPTDEDKVYRTVRGLFRSIDLGNPAANINRFNGGLFAPDAALDALRILDRTLTPVIQLEKYDFASDLNVNILGHIFEQSLSDLEAERARLQNLAYDQKQGKRKQDGIFYTPEYITRYIVRQAVGGWLQERRREAGLDQLPELTDDDRASIRIGVGNRLVQPTTRVQKHIAAWEQYAQRLENIRVLDPACGSGAFLNEAFGYLLREGEQVNQELATLRAGQFKVFDFDRHILQHNLYGVDLNPESVDITRLSLWLQTANPGKPLTSLDHSIRCGNSLISDPAVAGPRAFNWHAAFPEVFEQGGFDVVIGNPPYVFGGNATLSKDEKKFFQVNYQSGSGKVNLFTLFNELSINLLQEKGKLSFIIPNTFLRVTSYDSSRRFLLDNAKLEYLTDLGSGVFADATTSAIIISAEKTKDNNKHETIIRFDTESNIEQAIKQDDFKKAGYVIGINTNLANSTILEKLTSNSILLGELCEELIFGVVITHNQEDIISDTPKPNYKKFLEGKHVGRYIIRSFKYLNYDPKQLHRARSPKIFEASEKLLIQRITGGSRPITVAYDNQQFYNKESINNLILKEDSKFSIKYILGLLNSRLINWFYTIRFTNESKLTVNISKEYLSQIPIPDISPAEQQPFISAAEALLAGHKELHAAEAQFEQLVRAELGLGVPLTGKLAPSQEWKPWSTALERALGRKLTLTEKQEWLGFYAAHQERQQQRRAALQAQDAALDQLVYQLYQLTPAEIALVEGR
ncbi:Eco57I restriction-modification methylase domain-containing protein [Hymenobacter cavernae]|uniref:site-specific DNA-methyltransferase (adenine-specific) n=1 Tax=Hymenobacter cavernae TaxID=2044852 RepID=A0ABQ1TJS5_9BACT|nr:TaqI-like C-terminal specificity domain-containing protein [Hymenobacter cavernae]GGE97237.1 type II endonuclease-methyltransferasefusion protein [Hymenobacter cavernae]